MNINNIIIDKEKINDDVKNAVNKIISLIDSKPESFDLEQKIIKILDELYVNGKNAGASNSYYDILAAFQMIDDENTQKQIKEKTGITINKEKSFGRNN